MFRITSHKKIKTRQLISVRIPRKVFETINILGRLLSCVTENLTQKMMTMKVSGEFCERAVLVSNAHQIILRNW